MSKLEKILFNNNIDKEYFESIVYENLLLSIFEEIFNYLEEGNNKKKLVAKLRFCSNEHDEIFIFENIISDITKIKLDLEEKKYLLSLVKCYLRKTNSRIKINKNIKIALLKEQKYRCNICKTLIDTNNCHIDHIIPFKYVGDELNSNYQVLCKKCNLSKKDNLIYLFKIFIKKDKEAFGQDLKKTK